MKQVLYLLILAVALAIVKAVLVALAIALFLALVHAFVSRPAETLLLLGVLTLFGLAFAQPLACVITLGVLGAVAVVADARVRSRREHKPNERRWPLLSDSGSSPRT